MPGMKADPIKIRLEPYLDDLRNRKISGREVARKLGVHECSVSQALKNIGFTKNPKPSRAEQKTLRAARLAHRKNAALTLSVREAAKACKVHPRTITRLLKKMKA